MKRTTLLAFSILALAASARAEPQASDVRKVDAFSGIDLAGTLVVEARIDSTSKVEVRGDADLVKLVTTTVKNGVLVIDTPDDFPRNLKRKNAQLRVVVQAPDLSRVTISGTGRLAVEGIAAKTLVASVPGTGELRLVGKAERLKLDVSGTAEVAAKRLVTAAIDLDVPGTTKASLHAAKSFDANVSGTAMVAVHGKPPSVKKQISGMAMIDMK